MTPPKERFIETPFGTTRCLVAADQSNAGPLTLLVHGSGGCADVWRPMLELFRHVRAMAVDLPGHGGSTGPRLGTAEEYAAFIDSLRASLGQSRVLVVGQSLGGAIAQRYALDYAGQCAGIVIANSAPDFHITPERFDAITGQWEQAVDAYAAGQVSPGASDALKAAARRMVSERDPAAFVDDLAVCNRFSSRAWASRLAVPTMILAGREDVLTAPERSLALLELIRHAEFVMLTPCGHCTMLEQPARFAAEVDLFALHSVGSAATA